MSASEHDRYTLKYILTSGIVNQDLGLDISNKNEVEDRNGVNFILP